MSIHRKKTICLYGRFLDIYYLRCRVTLATYRIQLATPLLVEKDTILKKVTSLRRIQHVCHQCMQYLQSIRDSFFFLHSTMYSLQQNKHWMKKLPDTLLMTVSGIQTPDLLISSPILFCNDCHSGAILVGCHAKSDCFAPKLICCCVYLSLFSYIHLVAGRLHVFIWLDRNYA